MSLFHNPAPSAQFGRTSDTTNREKSLRSRALFGVFLLLVSAFRLFYASTHGLVHDEAYYWEWTRRLASGYYDQGPGIALAIRFGTLFGHTTGVVRLAAVLDGVIIALCGYALASRIFGDERAGLLAGIFLNTVPMLFVGGILITHDSPQMTTWAAAMYCLARAFGVGDNNSGFATRRNREFSAKPIPRGPSPVWWILTGVFAGLSMDCKYTAVLFFPCLLLFLLKTSGGRLALRTPWPYLAVLIGGLVALPPLFWNAAHGWPSLRHILNLGGAHHAQLFDLQAAGDYLAGQLLVALLFLFTMGWASVTAWREGRVARDTGLLLASCFSWPIWLAFFLLSLHGKVEPNWPVPAYFTAAVVTPWLALRGLKDSTGGRRGWLKAFHIVSLALTLMVVLLLLYPETLLLLPGGQKGAAGLAVRTNEMVGWNQLAGAVESAGWKPNGPWQVAAVRYQDAAQLAFALPGQPTTYNLPVERRHNQYDLWPPLPPGSRAIVVIPEKDTASMVPQVRKLFVSVRMIEAAPLWRRPLYSTPIATYIVLQCSGYHGGQNGLLLNQW